MSRQYQKSPMKIVTEEDVLELGYTPEMKPKIPDDDLEVEVDQIDLDEREKDARKELKKQQKKIRKIEQNLKNAQDEEEQFEEDDEGDDDEEEEDDDQENVPPQKWKRQYGNNLVCFFVDNEPMMTIGPHWYMIIIILVVLFLQSYFLFEYFLAQRHKYIRYGSLTIQLMQIITYLLVSIINPGIASAETEPKSNEGLVCDVCYTTSQELTTYHCKKCNVCVEDYNYHCYWTGKCVGGQNIWYFYSFLITILVNIIFLIVLFVTN